MRRTLLIIWILGAFWVIEVMGSDHNTNQNKHNIAKPAKTQGSIDDNRQFNNRYSIPNHSINYSDIGFPDINLQIANDLLKTSLNNNEERISKRVSDYKTTNMMSSGFNKSSSAIQNPGLLKPEKPKSILKNHYSDYGMLSDHNHNKMENNLMPPNTLVFSDESLFETKSCQYSSNAELAILSTNELINYLKSTSNYECHARILFNYQAQYSPIIFANDKIQAVATEILNISTSYDGTYENGIYGLLCYIHIAEYFDFYYHSTISIDNNSLDAIANATDVLCNNQALLSLNAEASVILEEFLIILDLPGLRHREATLYLIKQIFSNMVIFDTWKTSPEISWVFGYWRIYYLMFRGCVNNDIEYLTAIANDSEFIESWGSVCTDLEIMNNSDINYLYQDNAINEMARVAPKQNLTNQVCPHLYEVSILFPRLHKNWIRAVLGINIAGQCNQYNLCVNEAELRNELEAFLFPNTFYYNDSNLIFKAKFDKEVSDNLFYATRQVEAQFFRLVQTDQPVVGDVNSKLTCMVFESKQIYDDYAPYLYGISTNNGGMYLEQPSVFYTWDRPATYSLSLEELFRHEFTHYLQGRYLIPGYWGIVPFYNNNRLTWYEEGNAEFLCASTDFQGIKLKESTISTLRSDYPDWPTLTDVLTSYYGQYGSIFYPYGNLVWFNWYMNDYGKIKTFHDLTRNNDITGFDALVESIKNSISAELQWQSFLTEIYDNNMTGCQINTNWINDQNLTVSLISDIQNEFIELTGMEDISVALESVSSIGRFQISGEIVSTKPSSSLTDAAIEINLVLDTLMIHLKNNQFINNFYYSVGYFTDLTIPNNLPTATFRILGSLRDPNVPDDPVADFKAEKCLAITGSPVNFVSLSQGYIKGYQWSFPGGTPSVSNSINPTVHYDSLGSYTVTLTVTGKSSSITTTKTIEDLIRIYPPPSKQYCTATNGNNYAWISKVKIQEIDNSSVGFPTNGYSDFSSDLVTELNQDSTYSISVDLSYINSPSMNIGVWIDFNNNGSFEDEGEQVLLAHPPQLSQLTDATITIPSNAPNVITRMRVRANYRSNIIISPCGYDYYAGETEDYSVVIGDIFVNPIADFSSNNKTILTNNTVNFTSTSSGMIREYQWSFPGGTPSVSNEENPVITYDSVGIFPVTLTVKGFTPLQSDSKTIENFIKVYPPPSKQYCTATNGYNYAWISKVKIREIDNSSSGFPPNGYSDFSSDLVTELNQDSIYSISVDLSYINSPSMNIGVWIDFNNNGSFTDTGEQVVLAHPPQMTQLVNATFSIPSNASNVVTRIRVRANYRSNGIVTPCGYDSYMGETEDYAVVISNRKGVNLLIPSGWSGLSTYILPDDGSFNTIFQPIIQKLIVLQTLNGIFFPSQNINTIGSWQSQSAFEIKVSEILYLQITGSENQNKSLELNAGWNLIPVICNIPVDPVPLFSPVSNDLKIVKEVAGTGVYWPEYGINSLGSLLPGKAYFVKMNNAGTITFPQNDFSGFKTSDYQKEPEQPSPWGWIYKTPSSHLFALPANITKQYGDNSFIGAFTTEGVCAGTCFVNKGHSTVLVANPDDPLTAQKDGFVDGEPLSFRIWDAVAGKEYLLQVEYGLNQPDHSGIFAANGISAISGIQLFTGIREEFLKGIKIFPNPTNGKLNISGIASGNEIKVTIISSTGKSLQVIALKSDGAIDVSHLSTGVYFLKLEDGNSVRFEKVVAE